MMRLLSTIISFIILVVFPIGALGKSQSLPTNRVYYVDNSYSMYTNNLWNLVKSNLINAISKVSNENDLITVALFSDKSLGLPAKTVKANKNGIYEIQKFIEGQSYVSSSLHTHHYIPFEDFINNRIKNGYINMMFVLTDGGDEYFDDNVQSGYSVLNKSWKGLLSPGSHVFGFYVDLNQSRNVTALNTKFKGKELPWTMFEGGARSHLYIVDGSDLDINLIRFDDEFQNIDIRKTNRLRVEYSGYIKSKNDIILEQSNPDFNISIESLDNNAVVLAFSPVNATIPLPDNSEIKLKFSLKRINGKATNDIGTKRMSFLASDRFDDLVTVRFIDEKNKFASIELKGSDDIDILHYNSFLCKDQRTDTVIRTVSVKFSDAAQKENCSVQLRFINDSESIVVLDESNCPIDRIVISPNKADYIVKFTSSSSCQYPFEGIVHLDLENFSGLDFIKIGDDTIQTSSKVNLREYCIIASSTTNPLIWWLAGIISFPFLLYLILKCYYKIVRNSKPKFPGGKRTLQFGKPSKDISIINFSLIDCGNKGKKLGIISNDKGSSLHINKLAHECVSKVVLLNVNSKRPDDTPPRKCNGWILYVSTDFNNYTFNHQPIERIEIKPLRDKHVKLEIYCQEKCLKCVELDANKINNPQIEDVSDCKHIIYVHTKKAKPDNF